MLDTFGKYTVTIFIALFGFGIGAPQAYGQTTGSVAGLVTDQTGCGHTGRKSQVKKCQYGRDTNRDVIRFRRVHL